MMTPLTLGSQVLTPRGAVSPRRWLALKQLVHRAEAKHAALPRHPPAHACACRHTLALRLVCRGLTVQGVVLVTRPQAC